VSGPDTIAAGPTVIPFGADTVAAAQVIKTDNGYDYRLPCADIQPGKALRLNSGGLVFGTPPPLAAMPAVADQLLFLRGHFQHHCGLWSKPARLFIERYFEIIEMEISAHRAELQTSLERFGTLYEVEHWAFSALRPLPRAHLAAGENPGDAPPESLVCCDIAFWSAKGAVAIDLVGTATRGGAEKKWRARLDAACIRVIEIHPAQLADSDSLRACLPDDFHEFWRDEVLPTGPFRADAGPLVLPA
jgi:hypothetical protein